MKEKIDPKAKLPINRKIDPKERKGGEMKLHNIHLSEKAEKYYNTVAYGLEGKRGVATQAEIINYCLEILSDFEEAMGRDVLHFLFEESEKRPITIEK